MCQRNGGLRRIPLDRAGAGRPTLGAAAPRRTSRSRGGASSRHLGLPIETIASHASWRVAASPRHARPATGVSRGTPRAVIERVRASSVTTDGGYTVVEERFDHGDLDPSGDRGDGDRGEAEDRTLDGRPRPAPLAPILAEQVIELVLERADARVAQRSLGPRVPVIAITLGARAIDLGGTGLALAALTEVAARAVATFSDAGALTVVRPGDGPSFLFPLAQDRDDDDDDPVVRWCRAQDDEQTRYRVVALAERFQHELERSSLLRDVLIEVRLGEGAIVGAPARAGRLLPSASWRPA